MANNNLKPLPFIFVCCLLLALAVTAGAEDPPASADIVTIDVCPSTPGHFRNDWSLIFPLNDGLLMLAWCEYYATKPSQVTPISEDLIGANKLFGGTSDAASCRISGKISADRGRTWGDTFTLQDNLDTLNVKHPNLLRLASNPNRILLIFTKRYREGHEIRLFMKQSDNECENWSEPREISSLPGVHYLMADRILQLPTGRIILPTFQSDAWFPFDAFCYYSDDDGETWETSETKMELTEHGAQEPTVVHLKDGSLLAILRTSLGTLHKSYSHDNGENWTKPVSTGLPSPASTPLLKTIPKTGDLVLIWNNIYDPKDPEFQNGYGPRNPLVSAISKDSGETWQNCKSVEDRPGGASMTPAVTFLGDEAFVTYATQKEKLRKQERFSVRLKIIPVNWFYQ